MKWPSGIQRLGLICCVKAGWQEVKKPATRAEEALAEL